MQSFSPDQKVYYIGRRKQATEEEAPSPYLVKKAAFMGLIHIAGNLFECPSSRDLWKVRGGKILRLTEKEVDNKERVKPADAKNPSKFLKDILSELEF